MTTSKQIVEVVDTVTVVLTLAEAKALRDATMDRRTTVESDLNLALQAQNLGA